MKSPFGLLCLAVVFVFACALCLTIGAGSLVAGQADVASTNEAGPGPGSSRVPQNMLTLYQQAAVVCPGLPWTVLAAIGTVESSNGTSRLPGVHSGANYAGAEGPMQFEPATFSEYDEPVPAGGVDPPSPYDPVDAVYAAARLLCANGAAGGANLPGAIFAYNHSQAYVDEVMQISRKLSGE